MPARHLSAAERQRLVALLGMLGSDQPGEVANAARLAERFRRQYGMTWDDLLNLDAPPPKPPKPQPPPPPKPRPRPESEWSGSRPEGEWFKRKEPQKAKVPPAKRTDWGGLGFGWAFALTVVGGLIICGAMFGPNTNQAPPSPKYAQPAHHIEDPMKSATPPRIVPVAPAESSARWYLVHFYGASCQALENYTLGGGSLHTPEDVERWLRSGGWTVQRDPHSNNHFVQWFLTSPLHDRTREIEILFSNRAGCLSRAGKP